LKIQLVKLGKLAHPEYRPAIEEYFSRLKPFTPIEYIESKETELSRVLKNKEAGQFWILLDEKGKEWTSKDFASELKTWREDPSIKSLHFIVGSAYGFQEEDKKKASKLWSLSKATLAGDLAWLVLWEQIYRAFTILKGMPYHHE